MKIYLILSGFNFCNKLDRSAVGPWLWKEVKNEEEKVKFELRGRHGDCHWVEVRKGIEKME
jgi:hypothetical protein